MILFTGISEVSKPLERLENFYHVWTLGAYTFSMPHSFDLDWSMVKGGRTSDMAWLWLEDTGLLCL